MNIHKNARLTPKGREVLVRRILVEGLRPADAAQACGVSTRTAYKWLRRYREEGRAGLQDRPSRPRHSPLRTPQRTRAQIIHLRRQRKTYRQINKITGASPSTIARILAREGLNRLSALDPPAAPRRYVWDHPGDLLHLDIKQLGRFHAPGHRVTGRRTKESRGIGWEYLHVAIDDASRIAFSSLWPDQSSLSACAFLLQAIRYYRTFGITIRRLLTDNGPCYHARRFRRLCRRLGIKLLYTKPYSPQTNGKAERFIQTALREWAYARTYQDSEARKLHLPLWLHEYNWHRPHASLRYLPPVSSLGLAVNNLVRLHT